MPAAPCPVLMLALDGDEELDRQSCGYVVAGVAGAHADPEMHGVCTNGKCSWPAASAKETGPAGAELRPLSQSFLCQWV
jgi:hypothetical protein